MLQNRKLLPTLMLLLLSASLYLTGCDVLSSGEDASTSNITLQFATSGTSSQQAKVPYSNQLQSNHDTLEIQGSNGTLVIRDLRFIVEDFELERANEECDDAENGDDSGEGNCEEFKSKSFFVDLPLQGDTLDLATQPIESGLYEELEFKVDDLDMDEEEEDSTESKQQLIAKVRDQFPDWPSHTSMVILGDFISSQGDTAGFKTFAEAEIEIEMEFNPPLDVSKNNVNKMLRVNIEPSSWFLRNDGTVRDLSQYDYESTNKTLEFKVEIGKGFTEIEVDEDDGDDDDDDNSEENRDEE